MACINVKKLKKKVSLSLSLVGKAKTHDGLLFVDQR